ncbi:MAG: hypothetical protein WBL63_02360 [Candidatus Acidiferrum sp.]
MYTEIINNEMDFGSKPGQFSWGSFVPGAQGPHSLGNKNVVQITWVARGGKCDYFR